MKPRLHTRTLVLVAMLLVVRTTQDGNGQEAKPVSADAKRVNYTIIITGAELLDGNFADSHTPFLTRTLHPLGLHCVGSMIVDDRIPDIQAALRFATNQASLVILTGGLGPTDNDVTRQALVEFTGLPAQEHPDVLTELARRFRTSPEELRENLRRQTRVPARGTYLKNRNGSAVGLVFDAGNTVVVALPGPPRELQPMVQEGLVPYLTRRFGTRPPGCTLTLRFVGIGQSQIDQTLKEHIPLDRDIILASAFDGSRVDFTFSLPDDSPSGRARLRQLEDRILRHLGDFAYADDGSTLEQVIIAALKQRQTALAIVELGSGGSLAATLNTVPEAASVLVMSLTFPSCATALALLKDHDDKDEGQPAVDPTPLDSLAGLAKRRTQANAVIVVGEEQKEPGGARHVEVLLLFDEQPGRTFRLSFRGTDSNARTALSTQILDHVRRSLDVRLRPK